MKPPVALAVLLALAAPPAAAQDNEILDARWDVPLTEVPPLS